jgi:toxin-antitoxin system PIN domain toxin
LSATLDTNILVYASNERDPAHRAARSLLERLTAGPDLLYLFWPTLLGYVRLVTSPRILVRPLGPVAAVENVSGLVQLPHVRTPGEADGFWDLYRATAGDRLRGNDVPDGHIATLMRQHGVRLIYTRDRGLRRFEGIQVLDPFAQSGR